MPLSTALISSTEVLLLPLVQLVQKVENTIYQAMTESVTRTWGLEYRTWGHGMQRYNCKGTWGLRDARILRHGDKGMWKGWDSGTWDSLKSDKMTQGCNRQTTPYFYAEFVKVQVLVLSRKELYAGEFVSRPMAASFQGPHISASLSPKSYILVPTSPDPTFSHSPIYQENH